MLRLSKGERALGTIKNSAEDFIVEEIAQNGTPMNIDTQYAPDVLGMQPDPEGKFSVFVMQKYNWNTVQALKAISNKLGRGIQSVGFAGTKDRISKSTQLCSIFGVDAGSGIACACERHKDKWGLEIWEEDRAGRAGRQQVQHNCQGYSRTRKDCRA